MAAGRYHRELMAVSPSVHPPAWAAGQVLTDARYRMAHTNAPLVVPRLVSEYTTSPILLIVSRYSLGIEGVVKIFFLIFFGGSA